MSPATGTGRTRGKGRSKAMDGEEQALGGPDPETRQEAAEEQLHSSTSDMALIRQAPTVVRPPLRARLPGDGQHCRSDATPSSEETHQTPPPASPSGRRDLLEQMQVQVSKAEILGITTTTTLVIISPHAHRSLEQQSIPFKPTPILLQLLAIHLL